MKKSIRIIIIVIITLVITPIIVGFILLSFLNYQTKSIADEKGLEYRDANDMKNSLNESNAARTFIDMKIIFGEIIEYYDEYNNYPNSFADLDDYQKQERSKNEIISVERGDTSGKIHSIENFERGNFYDSFKYKKTEFGFEICFEIAAAYKTLNKGHNCINQNFFK